MVREGVGVIEERSCKVAAKAVAGINFLTLKWLSWQGIPLEANQQQKKTFKPISCINLGCNLGCKSYIDRVW